VTTTATIANNFMQYRVQKRGFALISSTIGNRQFQDSRYCGRSLQQAIPYNCCKVILAILVLTKLRVQTLN